MNKKSTIKSLFFAAFVVGGTLNGFAQTAQQKERIIKETNVLKLQELSAEFSKNYREKKAEALRLAEINNWPLVIENERGKATLMDVSPEGLPLYYGTQNVGSAITSRANHLQPGGSLGLNLTGLGMEVGVWDGEYPLVNHADFVGRFFTNDGSPTPTAFHPTHVLGTIIASGVNNPAARGIAYEAIGVISNYDNDLAEMADIASLGLVLSNHSYGLISSNVPSAWFGAYINQSKAVDEITFYAPRYQPVFAAGNDGDGTYDNLTAWNTAKNVVVVAAVSEVNSFNADGTPTNVNIANFSNWGPTDDNRIKPDISSKGINVLSTSNASPTAYGTSQGTSMAAPGITGAFTLLQQHYKNLHNGTFMWSSTLRGLMAHTADDAGNAGPDAKFGWGLMNSKKAAEAITGEGESTLFFEQVLTPGTTFERQVYAVGGAEKLIATLAWTDPAGTVGQNKALVNDLDIRVVRNDGNVTNFPWKLGSSQTANAIKGDNSVDNIEKVEVNSTQGWYTITVSHKGNTLVNPGTSFDDEQGNLPVPQQMYSLIVSGIDATALSTESVKSSMFSVWPNPANDILNITLGDQASGEAHITLYDVQGRTVLQDKLFDVNNVINIGHIAKGVYFANVTSNGVTEVKRIIVK